MDMTLENRDGLPTVESDEANPCSHPRVPANTTPNPALQRSGNSRLRRLLPPGELRRWADIGRPCGPVAESTRVEAIACQALLRFL
jgi:hypothetical protein